MKTQVLSGWYGAASNLYVPINFVKGQSLDKLVG